MANYQRLLVQLTNLSLSRNFNNCWLQSLRELMLLVSWLHKVCFELRQFNFLHAKCFVQGFTEEWKYMYIFICIFFCCIFSMYNVVFCLLLCTHFIADEELCRWIFDLGVSSSHCWLPWFARYRCEAFLVCFPCLLSHYLSRKNENNH
jgi:hypothetical protein